MTRQLTVLLTLVSLNVLNDLLTEIHEIVYKWIMEGDACAS
jgi:hypothetical protein